MKVDLISILEATYAEATSDQEWLDAIVRAARPALDGGLGASGYLYDLRTPPLRAHGYVDIDTPISSEVMSASLATATDDYIEKSWKVLLCGTASEVPGFDEQPALDLFFRPRGVEDVLGVNAYDPCDRVGVWIGAPLSRRLRLRKTQREMWNRISAHVATGYRLRRRVATLEAILTPQGKTVHAEGDAKLRNARASLREAAIGIERARGSLRRRDPEDALVSWRALVAAR